MKHHQNIRKLGRTKKLRTALLRSLALALLERGRITTTEARAKELRPFIEKLVTLGKKKTLASQRLIVSRLASPMGTRIITKEIASRYESRAGGYTRITKLPPRSSDGARMAVIEWV